MTIDTSSSLSVPPASATAHRRQIRRLTTEFLAADGFRFFYASYSVGNFLPDGHERVIVSDDKNLARLAADGAAPYAEATVYMEEVSPAEFNEILDINGRLDPNRKWIIGVFPEA
ncbi:hypothetical protein [Neorhizobium alkalisoli]|uniref:hypothetical protein n=1 Tax=Neorhizobium alkalisoli TaxID=528178 RepID=UPI000CF99159|nr:hypothetical protein [Neorhizobium alkalisoli]